MKLKIEACAEAEIWQAIEHYEGCREGLGSDFSIEVDACFDWIMQHPLAWPVFDGTARRCQLRRFPYAVVYQA
jgi:toxin ParE2